MAITPGTGYIVDPNNPNAVIKDPGYASPAPGVITPANPINPNANLPGINPSSTTVPPVNTNQPSPTTVNATPYTGNSIVDALNSSGQASDFASRTALAAKNGITNYTGTADQNTQLLQKYRAGLAQAQASGQPAPTTSAGGTAMTSQYTPPTPPAVINPVDTMLAEDKGYQQLMKDYADYQSSQSQRVSLVDEYKKMQADAGLPELNAEMLNMKNVIDGTEDDIRNEVTKVNGFATESQVLALAGARNKGLIKNYNKLVDTINNAQSNISTMMGLSAQDRQYADEQFKTKLNFDAQVMQYRDKMQQNAVDAYNKIIDKAGYAGLYQATGGDAHTINLVEKTLGLQPGGLKQLSTYVAPLTAEEQLRNKNLELQNKKLTQDLTKSKSVNTQVIDVNGKKMLINSDTGDVIKEIGSGSTTATNQVSQAQSQGNIQLISGLISDSALNGAVGPNKLGRLAPIQSLTGAKSNFIAGVEQLKSQLTLDSLIRAKAQGATFGALSEGELNTLSSSATKIGTWAIKDKNGNVAGYNTSEESFKKELDKINNYAKLDYILKGGNPSDVEVMTMPDGTHWTMNSDGTMTQL